MSTRRSVYSLVRIIAEESGTTTLSANERAIARIECTHTHPFEYYVPPLFFLLHHLFFSSIQSHPHHWLLWRKTTMIFIFSIVSRSLTMKKKKKSHRLSFFFPDFSFVSLPFYFKYSFPLGWNHTTIPLLLSWLTPMLPIDNLKQLFLIFVCVCVCTVERIFRVCVFYRVP